MTDPLATKSEGEASREKLVTPSARLYKVALLCGGTSSEREVSLASAANVEKALSEAGHEVVMIDTANPDFLTTIARSKPDVAFIALHGKGGEDGSLQGALELMNIPYTGSGVLGSALAMDKHRSKIVYEAYGLKTAPSLYIRSEEKDTPVADPARIIDELGLPVVVKPSSDGSSVGISIVREKDDLTRALEEAFATGTQVLVEKYIVGTEITVSVLGSTCPRALPAIEIIPKSEFYDYESKYAEGGSVHIVPARISANALAEAFDAAIKAHEGLDCYGISRTDMIIDEDDQAWVIETNTIPGMTATSLLPDAASYLGISNQELYELFIVWALERQG